MDIAAILAHVDHTLLKPTASLAEIEALCAEAVKYKTASACIPPSRVKAAKTTFPTLNVCTVIGFPLGYESVKTKLAAAEAALHDGAGEIDMVINIGRAKEGDFASITEEIAQIKRVCASHVLKVIIETCYLDRNEKIALCRSVTEGGADYIKTSTGFGPSGAALNDIELFKRHIGPNVRIKAAGGIRSLDEARIFIESGCDRIGSSALVVLALAEIASETGAGE